MNDLTKELREQYPRIGGGIWKFRPNVDSKVLIVLGKEWQAKEPCRGGVHFDLFVRGCSGSQEGLCFKYAYHPQMITWDQFFDKMTDLLKRRFGNDFVGWDVSGFITEVDEMPDPV